MTGKSKWRYEIGDIIQELKKGPASTKNLTEKVVEEGVKESARRRISRHLKKLHSWNLVEKEGKNWHWFEHVRSFESGKDYELHLKHSRKLLEEASEKSLPIGADKPDFDYEPLHKHLLTGYPQIKETFEEAKTLRERVEKKEKYLEELIVEKIKERNLASKKDKILKVGGINHKQILEILLYHSPDDRPRPNFDDIDVNDKGWIIHNSVRNTAIALLDHVSLDGVKKLMQNIKESKEIKKVMKSFNQLRDKLLEKESKIHGKFSYLEKKVEHGEPLKGSCSLCPKIKVKKK